MLPGALHPPTPPAQLTLPPAPGDDTPGTRDAWAPPAGWPAVGQITYAREAITLLFLLLALPWVVWKLVTDPGRVISGAGRKHI